MLILNPMEAYSMSSRYQRRRGFMLHWAVSFLIIAIVAAVFGFGGIAGTATEMAKILFLVFLALFLVSIIAPRLRPRT